MRVCGWGKQEAARQFWCSVVYNISPEELGVSALCWCGITCALKSLLKVNALAITPHIKQHHTLQFTTTPTHTPQPRGAAKKSEDIMNNFCIIHLAYISYHELIIAQISDYSAWFWTLCTHFKRYIFLFLLFGSLSSHKRKYWINLTFIFFFFPFFEMG